MDSYLYFLTNWIDLAIVAVVLAGFILGLSQGLLRQGFTLGALYVSFVLALQYYTPVANYAYRLWPQTDTWSRTTFGMALVFIVSFLVLNLLSYYIYQDTRLSVLGIADRSGGALAGAVGAWILIGIFINLLGLSFQFVWGGWESFEFSTQSQFNQSALVKVINAQTPMLFATIKLWLPEGLPIPFFI